MTAMLPLAWHWTGTERICDACGAEVWFDNYFNTFYCIGCGREDNWKTREKEN